MVGHNELQRFWLWFRCVETKIAKSEEPIVQQLGISEWVIQDAMGHKCCYILKYQSSSAIK